MDILKTKTALVLGLSGAMSMGTATADIQYETTVTDSSIISVSSPDLRVTVYDGIATVIGSADSRAEADTMEREILDVPGIEHVINLITWG